MIRDDHENNKESTLTSSSPSITPCPEASSLAILSVNDELNDNWSTTIEEEEEITSTSTTTTTTVVHSRHYDNAMQEEEEEKDDDYEVDDAILARECALLVEGCW